MPIDKLIPQYLNLDDDERILKSYEMVDALNVRISHEEDGDAGVIKNVEGNKIIPPKNAVEDALPTSGRNRCVGVCTSEAHKCVYFFIYNIYFSLDTIFTSIKKFIHIHFFFKC